MTDLERAREAVNRKIQYFDSEKIARDIAKILTSECNLNTYVARPFGVRFYVIMEISDCGDEIGLI